MEDKEHRFQVCPKTLDDVLNLINISKMPQCCSSVLLSTQCVSSLRALILETKHKSKSGNVTIALSEVDPNPREVVIKPPPRVFLMNTKWVNIMEKLAGN